MHVCRNKVSEYVFSRDKMTQTYCLPITLPWRLTRSHASLLLDNEFWENCLQDDYAILESGEVWATLGNLQCLPLPQGHLNFLYLMSSCLFLVLGCSLESYPVLAFGFGDLRIEWREGRKHRSDRDMSRTWRQHRIDFANWDCTDRQRISLPTTNVKWNIMLSVDPENLVIR